MEYKYDIAISYKSEMEEKAAKIADFLMADGWKVFFAPEEQEELLSEKLHQKLYEIYKNESMMKVLLISKGYLESEWTALEKRVSLESTKEQRKRLLIVNYTGEVFENELKSLVYIDGRKYHEDEIAAIITKRLKGFLDKREYENICNEGTNSIVNNSGIITGDNAYFGNVQFRR